MALLSKFLEDFGATTGIPAIAISRTLYSAAILGYIYNVALPEWKKSRKNPKQIGVPGEKKIRREEEDEKVQEIVRQVSQHVDNKESKPKGPAVNR